MDFLSFEISNLFLFRSYMPVWWSPSSKTALAEAELEYNNEHRSRTLYVRVLISKDSLPPSIQQFGESKTNVYGLVWTTTGWSFVGNKAVCYNPSLEYSLFRNNGDLYLVATDLLSQQGTK